MKVSGYELNRLTDYVWEVPKTGGMLVPGRIYTSREMIENTLQNDEAVKQVVNVAHLPGIRKYSIAMPDIHWGYGFPIGGVAATGIDDGVVSPGGVGYDINCGVRLARTSLTADEVKKKTDKLANSLFHSVPTGVGASGAIRKLSEKDVKDILRIGSRWAVQEGLGTEADLDNTEENGCLEGADISAISKRAIERGLDQAGTLGSGNHFLEVDIVDNIYDEDKAEVFGLFKGQIVVQIHSGSRGLGYQVCDDYLKVLRNASDKYGFELPDKQLACAPVKSEEGSDYLGAMRGAANFAWNNRQVIMHLAKKSFLSVFGISEQALGFGLVYDVCHNIAKLEEHNINGNTETVCVHRKGATRAFPPGNKDIPARYRSTGQPVLIPGDMGRYSYVAAGMANSMEESFGSSCHGAGRVQSRTKALKAARGRNLEKELAMEGITVRAKGKRTMGEEMPYAYKDVSDVVNVMHFAGISEKVARLKPLCVIKG